MKAHILKKIILGLTILLSQTNFSQTINQSEESLNVKYWTMRERFRKYFVRIGSGVGGSIPVAQRQDSYNNLMIGNRCEGLYPDSKGMIKWGDATSYLGNYMCVLATEYALLAQQGKDTKATLNELYYAINAIDRLDSIAEPIFSENSLPPNNNGFFLRDDVTNATVSWWSDEYINTGGYDPKLNYRCLDADRQTELGNTQIGNRASNEISFDQMVAIFEGFSFIKKYVPNLYIKPTSQDVGFNIIDKMQAITSNIMEYISGADVSLLRSDHGSEFVYTVLNPIALFMTSDPIVLAGISALSQCADNDIRGNWIMINPVTRRKVGSSSNDTKNQDIRPFAYPIAKAGELLTGNTYTDRDIHHKVVDQFNDSWACLDAHDYHIPLNWVKTHVWDEIELKPNLNDGFVVIYPEILLQKKPLCFKYKGMAEALPFKSVARNMYILEKLGVITGTWSHANVNKFATYYQHEDMDLAYACLNDKNPQKSQAHYINLLNKLTCDGPRNYGPNDFTSFWNNGTSFENPTYDEISTESFNYGEYNANDWMWMYNMYRLKFGNSSFPSYEDAVCICKKSPTLEYNVNSQTNNLETSITLKRIFKPYLKLGISLKEYTSGALFIQNNIILANETEFVVCDGDISVANGGVLKNNNSLFSDSVKIVTNGNNASITVGANGKFEIGANTKVIIKKHSTLTVGGLNATILVKNGGTLIIEAGGKFFIENQGKLIVENGGQVIIQSDLTNPTLNLNGLLTFNQGAEIQLKGNDAVLEINGRLHISNNASFTFTYPGSASGYVKFNRGAGVWWDNWAPNNAHITCGSNASFNIKGTSKTDKVIEINQNLLAMPKNLKSLTINTGLVEFNVLNAMLETDAVTALNNSTFVGKILNGQVLNTRGVAMFGQAVFVSTGSDYINLGTGITGALFYGNKKLTNITNCNFIGCKNAIRTIGAGILLRNNTFFNNQIAVINHDLSFNSEIKNNTINSNLPLYTELGNGAIGIYAHGSDITYEVSSNKINNQNIGLGAEGVELKLKCNDLKLNSFALLGATESKINMSTILGAGFNNAHNCNQFARFYEASYWESNMGYNSMRIANNNPCVTSIGGGSGHPTTQYCPTITDGSLINFTNYNVATGFYQLVS